MFRFQEEMTVDIILNLLALGVAPIRHCWDAATAGEIQMRSKLSTFCQCINCFFGALQP
jgi:hypothetical protein